MKLSIGFSTCPNDTFIFDALIHGKTPSFGLEFEPVLADVEELNRKALRGELDVTKLSYHAFGHTAQYYRVLDSGSALGYGNGPLLVCKNPNQLPKVEKWRVAIPGFLTTANFLMGIAYPQALQKEAYLFSEIEERVLQGDADVGVIIHENRFTYAERGLQLIADLGAYWEKETSLPIPLGGIVVNRKIPQDIQEKVQKGISESLRFAFEHPESALPYMLQFAQNMRPEILKKHVATFVNDFSLELGEKGRQAVIRLMQLGSQRGLFPEVGPDIFVSPVD